jgi:hypothetical protein
MSLDQFKREAQRSAEVHRRRKNAARKDWVRIRRALAKRYVAVGLPIPRDGKESR